MRSNVRWKQAKDNRGVNHMKLKTFTLAGKKYNSPEFAPKYVWVPETEEPAPFYSTRGLNYSNPDVQSGDIVPTVDKIMQDTADNFYVQRIVAPSEELIDLAERGEIVPSVTTVLSYLEKSEGLERWKKQQMLDFIGEMVKGKKMSKARWEEVAREAINYDNKEAAEKGTRWHSAIEQYAKGEKVKALLDEEMQAFLESLPNIDSILQFAKGFDLERSFVHQDGFGGTADLRAGNILLDWKTKTRDLFGKRGGIDRGNLIKDSLPVQLAAYAHGLGIEEPRLINVFIDTRNGEVAVYEYSQEAAKRALHTWNCLLAYWKSKINSAGLRDGTEIKIEKLCAG